MMIIAYIPFLLRDYHVFLGTTTTDRLLLRSAYQIRNNICTILLITQLR